MPIETKPEQKTLHGAELLAALVDAMQRALDKRVDPKTLQITFADGGTVDVEHVRITVDVVGSLKGPKVGAKRAARKPKPAPAA